MITDATVTRTADSPAKQRGEEACWRTAMKIAKITQCVFVDNKLAIMRWK